MKVFISWSGETSHAFALALAEWLPNVIQAVKPFLSSEDIQKGARWFAEIGNQLEETNFGILCLTPSNLKAPWILFEAGALSKKLTLARVVPLLINLKPADLTPPLSQFNAVAGISKEEMAKLLKAMNAALANDKLTDQQLAKAFEREWPDFQSEVKKVEQSAREKPSSAPLREPREMLEEILELTRSLARAQRQPTGAGKLRELFKETGREHKISPESAYLLSQYLLDPDDNAQPWWLRNDERNQERDGPGGGEGGKGGKQKK